MNNPIKRLLKILTKLFANHNAQVNVDTNHHSPTSENLRLATVSTLIVTLSHEDLRYHAIVALGNLGHDAAIAVPALIDLLQDADAVIRVTVIDSLCKIGSEVETIPALIGALQDESAYIRAHAAFGLGCFREKAVFAVDALVCSLTDHDELVRANAAEALAKIGKPAHRATPALIEVLGDRNGKVRAKAIFALASIATDTDIVPSLINTSSDNDSRVRAAAAEAFGCVLGCTCTDCVIALTLSLNDPDQYVRINAAKSLIKIGVQIPASMDTLMQILTTSQVKIRTTTVLNLGIIATYLKQHIHRLLVVEIQQLITHFETTIQIIATEKLEISEAAIAPIYEIIKQLKRELGR